MSTYVPIATQTLSTATSSVTFSSIPQNYTDLIIVINSKLSSGITTHAMQYNGDTGSNYSYTRYYGNDLNVATTDNSTNNTFARVGFLSQGYFNTAIYQINNYSDPNTWKACLGRSGILDYNGYVFSYVTNWRNKNPITSIKIFAESGGNFVANSTFTLYGVAAGNSSAKATGGNIVTTDGSYWYHTFTSSGTFIPSRAITVDYLVVAGGGGAGLAPQGGGSGGGGAGGLRSTVTATGGGGTLESALSLSSNLVYQIVVGAGGAAGSNQYPSSGTNSFISGPSITTITSIGGGASANSSNVNALSGGSGGGGAYQGSGGSGTANQGYAGGSGSPGGSPFPAGGGGGAGSAGGTGSGSSAGNGGNGVAVSISGSSVTYAGGGGGSGRSGVSSGSGGSGGGGGGGISSGSSATVNSGGGGGGASDANPGGNGGSGIVIIRYAV